VVFSTDGRTLASASWNDLSPASGPIAAVIAWLGIPGPLAYCSLRYAIDPAVFAWH